MKVTIPVDWRKILEIDKIDDVSEEFLWSMIEGLKEEADTLSDNGKFGMYVGIAAIEQAIERELLINKRIVDA